MGAGRALVVGGSVAGLLVALLLRRQGWAVSVHERALGDLAGRGAGLGVSQELLDVMARAGAPFAPSAGVPQRFHVWMAQDGSIRFEHRRNLMASAWARIYQPLREALPAETYRQGSVLERVEEEGERVTAFFAGGVRESADLLIAADGANSTARRQFLPGVAPAFVDYVAWRGLVEERDMPAETRAAVDGRLVFCFPPGGMLLCMVAPGAGEDTRPGHRRLYFIWYRTVRPEALAQLFTDDSGKHHGMSIPPPLIRAEVVRELKTDAARVLPAAIAHVVRAVSQPLLQAISDMESPRLAFGRVALAGDAAFVVRPHVAGGAGKAAMDAACLADSLVQASDVRAALADYECRQLDFGRRIVRHSRNLGAELERGATPRDPERIIREYGAPNILHDVETR
ncbi:MAG: FAD-dependent monooxygenase [Burkholderiales bacterium]